MRCRGSGRWVRSVPAPCQWDALSAAEYVCIAVLKRLVSLTLPIVHEISIAKRHFELEPAPQPQSQSPRHALRSKMASMTLLLRGALGAEHMQLTIAHRHRSPAIDQRSRWIVLLLLCPMLGAMPDAQGSNEASLRSRLCSRLWPRRRAARGRPSLHAALRASHQGSTPCSQHACMPLAGA